MYRINCDNYFNNNNIYQIQNLKSYKIKYVKKTRFIQYFNRNIFGSKIVKFY